MAYKLAALCLFAVGTALCAWLFLSGLDNVNNCNPQTGRTGGIVAMIAAVALWGAVCTASGKAWNRQS